MEKWTAKVDEGGTKLIPFVKKRLKTKLTLRQIRWLIEHNRCKINGKIERHCSTLIKPGDNISFWPDDAKGFAFEPSRVLFEDRHFLAYNKPPFITSAALVRLLPKGCQLVHRLDKETSGVILFAKGRNAKAKISTLFRNREIHKSYLAIVDGVIKEKEGVIECFMAEVKKKGNETRWGAVSEEKGVFAKTKWICLKSKKGRSYLRVHPVTGRTHQIRVHLSTIGHPLVGDNHYGKREVKGGYTPFRTLLHAEKLQFIHPFTQEPFMAFAPIPPDFRGALSAYQL